MHQITICLGSSCYSRGNQETLELFKNYLEEHSIAAEINFKGQLCSNQCRKGPVIIIDNKIHEGVLPATAIETLENALIENRIPSL